MYTKSNVNSSPLARQRIHLVDDDADTRELTRLILRAHGAEATAVDTAFEALSLLDSQAFDALVADIGLSGANGYRLMRTVRARPAGSGGRIPAVALTGFASAEDRDRALESGFDWHVAKPLDPNGLVKAIVDVLAGKRMGRES
jgi:CheY-like chemotaxis protein